MQILIEPTTTNRLNLKELWIYRELLYYLAVRDFMVRYKQTLLGIAWAILQPLLTTIIFTIFFNKVAGIQSGKIPYLLFAYIGLLFWNYFSAVLSDISNSLIVNQSIITKVFFPRLIVPLSAAAVSLIDFLIGAILLVFLFVFYLLNVPILGLIALIPLLLLTFCAAFGLGLCLSILNVKYRDVRYVLPFFTQLLLFVTPVIYPVNLVPSDWRLWLYLNPLTGIIACARAIFFGEKIDVSGLSISITSCCILFVLGIYFFQRFERKIADII